MIHSFDPCWPARRICWTGATSSHASWFNRSAPCRDPRSIPSTARDVTTYYVWDAFVRASHWLNVLALAVLVPRGFTSATRPFAPAARNAQLHVMGTVINLHLSPRSFSP